MKRIYLLVTAMVLLTATGCNNGPVYRPVEFVADSLVHDDIPKGMEETREMLEELENEPVITIPDIPQESDLLNDKNKIDVEKAMREGF
jgi:hypothetical protein